MWYVQNKGKQLFLLEHRQEPENVGDFLAPYEIVISVGQNRNSQVLSILYGSNEYVTLRVLNLRVSQTYVILEPTS